MDAKSTRFALLVIASMFVATDLAFIVGLGLSPFVLISPSLLFFFILAGPNPRLTVWRDALIILLIGIFILRGFVVPREWPKELRWSMGAVSSSAIPLLFLAYFHGDGLGLRMRRFSLTQTGAWLTKMSYYTTYVFALLFELAIIALILTRPETPRWLISLPLGALIVGLLPKRWSPAIASLGAVGCAGVLFSLIRAISHAWPWNVFWLFFWTIGIPSSIEKLRSPVPARRPGHI